jgi:hypothetical protein
VTTALSLTNILPRPVRVVYLALYTVTAAVLGIAPTPK